MSFPESRKAPLSRGTDVAGKAVERSVLPEEGLRPVREVVVPAGGFSHGFEYGLFRLVFPVVLDKEGRTIPEPPEVVAFFLGAMARYRP